MTFDWKQHYCGTLKWLPERTLFITRHGSQAYGTSTPSSDLDLRGITVAPAEYYLGVGFSFNQVTQASPTDLVIFDLRKFLKLASDTNPNALEILFTDPEDHLLIHPLMEKLFDIREAFLSTRALHTFSGYATSQMKRIRRHWNWLHHPPKEKPERADFGLPEHSALIPSDQLKAAESRVRKQLDSWSWRDLEDVSPDLRLALQHEFQRKLIDITMWGDIEVEEKSWFAATRACGFSTNFIELLDRERRYKAKLTEWNNYQKWLKERNPDRAALEAKFGYDSKHAMHLVRLSRMCEELLTTGKLTVRRPDAEDLLAIRNGAWGYEELDEYAERLDGRLRALVDSSPLPKKPDIKTISRVSMEIMKEMM